MQEECKKEGITLYYPSPVFCTDNAAMIAVQGYYVRLQSLHGEMQLHPDSLPLLFYQSLARLGSQAPLPLGVGEAKAIAYAAQKPLVGVHHIEGHIAANYIEHPDLFFTTAAAVSSQELSIPKTNMSCISAPTNDTVNVVELDGKECATIITFCLIRENDVRKQVYEKFMCRRDSQNKWKILCWLTIHTAVQPPVQF